MMTLSGNICCKKLKILNWCAKLNLYGRFCYCRHENSNGEKVCPNSVENDLYRGFMKNSDAAQAAEPAANLIRDQHFMLIFYPAPNRSRSRGFKNGECFNSKKIFAKFFICEKFFSTFGMGMILHKGFARHL